MNKLEIVKYGDTARLKVTKQVNGSWALLDIQGIHSTELARI